MEIILKYYGIRFDDSATEMSDESIVNKKLNKNIITKEVWDKVYDLQEHPNFNLNIFAAYIVNYVKPEVLEHKIKENFKYMNKKREELAEIKTYFNDKFGIVSFKTIINNPSTKIPTFELDVNGQESDNQAFEVHNREENINSNSNNNVYNNNNVTKLNHNNITSINHLWLRESDLLDLKNYIKDNIIGIAKIRNDIDNNFKSTIPNEEKNDDNEFYYNNKRNDIQENEIIDDIDFIEVIPYNENIEENDFEAKCNSFKTNNVDVDLRRNIQKNKLNEQGSTVEKEELLDLDELGVLEVDDDIFENFDEENIPIIKNIYKRKKCSAEKFKINTNNRNVPILNKKSQQSYHYSSNSSKD